MKIFRGQEYAEWKLCSGAVRRLVANEIPLEHPQFIEEYIRYHNELIDRVRQVIACNNSNQSIDDMQLLAKLQHFGAATGLLDFTYNPLVALWFACGDPSCNGKKMDSNGNVFILDKKRPNTLITNRQLEVESIDSLFSRELSRDQRWLGSNYLIWEPDLTGDEAFRILGQRSVFVIGRPIIEKTQFSKVEIDADDKKGLRDELEQIDISERTIFPDLLGICKIERAEAPYVSQSQVSQSQVFQSQLRRGNKAMNDGHLCKAIVAYGKCLDLDGKQLIIHFYRGNAYAAAKLYPKALSDYDNALNDLNYINENSPRKKHPWYYYAVLYNRGNIYALLNEHEKAIRDYEKAWELDSSFSTCMFNCGNSYYCQMNFEMAISCYKKVSSKCAGVLHNMALAYIQLGNFKSAEDCYMKMQMPQDQEQNAMAFRKLRTILAGYEDSELKKITSQESVTSVMFSHPCYTGEPQKVSFQGMAGNVGNVGGPDQPGGKGFCGGPGLVVTVK